MNHKQSVKEVIRHLMYQTGLFSLLLKWRKRRGYKTNHLVAVERAQRFEEIYAQGVWRHAEGQIATSGLGSELVATAEIRQQLPGLLRELGVETLVDIGCGDWTWMSQIKLPCSYLGLDIVSSVIERNIDMFGNERVIFRCLDAVTEDLPHCDAFICREVIFHLSFEDAVRVLDNMRRHSRWVIVTCDTDIWFNSDIPSGDFRMLNLQRRPFSFPPPDRYIPDAGLVRGRILGVWNTDRITLPERSGQ